ncbi:uncharacterized protein PV09_09375 [Verruconis gallopava]|uniref:Uncharacterized protein n=1 Tax=Verruconis gallopava TaxID=253628 RepID=A0A0D1X9M3_9PEZI|nr:uncharacterized protein PV09_09375 [Verruconis gallopava]KIV98885.1 hypothetical protein PV09_09375 [Verruconis gallopava]
MDVKEATNWITRALQKHETMKETEIAGVGVIKFGYVIRFKNEKSKEIASKHDEWLADLHPETKIDRP